MKLIAITVDQFAVATKQGVVSLGAFVRLARLKTGRTIGSIETHAGVHHPRVRSLERGESQSLSTFLQAIDELGYEVRITKKDAS